MSARSIFAPLVIGAIIILSACSKDKVYNVPPEVEVYVQRFEDEAQARGYDIEIKRLKVNFVDNLSNGGDAIAGRCNNPGGRTPHIELSSDFLEMSPEVQEQLVFHELGHCVLEREHVDAFMSNGHYSSIMNTHYWTYLEGQEYKRDHYLNELFNPYRIEPHWTRTIITHGDVAASQKTTLFSDDFDNNSNGWNLVNSNGHSISISGGQLLMSSSTTQGLAALRNFNIPGSDNYEIEASYRVVVDRDQTNAIFFQVDGIYHFFGIDRGEDVSIGLLTNPESVVTGTREGIDAGEYHTFTMRKLDDQMLFFIDGTLQDYRIVGQQSVEGFGFLIGAAAQIEVQSMVLNQITL